MSGSVKGPYFLPTGSGGIQDLLAEARLRLIQYRQAEVDSGLTPPELGDLSSHLRAAISMLVAGIQMKEWGLVAEGLVTVQEAELRARPPDGEPADEADPPDFRDAPDRPAADA